MPLSLKAIIGGGSSPVGSYLTGKLAADTNYLRCNAARYLLSAYPDVQTLVDSGQLVTNYEMSEQYTNENSIVPTSWNQFSTFAWVVDDSRILFGSRSSYSNDTHLISRSEDSGTTWTKLLLKSYVAVACGLNQSTAMTVHDIIKVGSNSYCAIVSDFSTNPKFFIIKTNDSFNTFSVIGGLRTLGTSVSFASAAERGRFVAGPDLNKLIAVLPTNGGAATLFLSADGGSTFAAISGTGATWTTTAIQFVECDGTNLFYANGTALYHIPWPTSTTQPAFTTVSSKFTGSCNRIKKLTNRFVAWNTSSGFVETSTTLTGTYTSTSWSGLQTINDIAEVGTKWFVFCYIQASGRYSLLHTTDAVAPSLPVERSFVSPALCSDLSVGSEYYQFQRRYGTGLNALQFIHGVMDIASTTNGTSYTAIYRHIPRSNQGVVKKYGYYYSAAVLNGDNNQATTTVIGMNGVTSRILYRSTNLKDWEPLFIVRSDVMDLGTKLYVLVPTGSNLVAGRQSSDGVTWNTTGITEPSKPTLQHYCKLHTCNGLLYAYYYDASGPSASYNVSLNQGLSWNSVSPLHVDFAGSQSGMFDSSSFIYQGCMAYFKGKYFHISSSWDGGNSYWRYRLGTSTDGVSWTFPLGGTWSSSVGNTSSTRGRGPIAVVLNDTLYINTGESQSGGYINTIRSFDGITFEMYMTGSYPDSYSALVGNSSNFATENGPDVYFVVRASSPYAVYKNGVVLSRATVGQTISPGTQALDETNDVYTFSHLAITRHPKTNVTFTTPNISTPTETYMRVKR